MINISYSRAYEIVVNAVQPLPPEVVPLEASVGRATAEDIILRKLERYTQSGNMLERQLRDVVGVMKVKGPELDLAYLRGWSRQLGVERVFEQCMEDAGLTD